jgi:hypothetical protein
MSGAMTVEFPELRKDAAGWLAAVAIGGLTLRAAPEGFGDRVVAVIIPGREWKRLDHDYAGKDRPKLAYALTEEFRQDPDAAIEWCVLGDCVVLLTLEPGGDGPVAAALVPPDFHARLTAAPEV